MIRISVIMIMEEIVLLVGDFLSPLSVTWPMLSHDFMLFISFLLFIDRVVINLLTISPGGEWF